MKIIGVNDYGSTLFNLFVTDILVEKDSPNIVILIMVM